MTDFVKLKHNREIAKMFADGNFSQEYIARASEEMVKLRKHWDATDGVKK